MNAHADIVVVGGGIAGLWIQRTLDAAGLDSILIEAEALGSGQTLASQGMVHGGQRYQLAGNPAAMEMQIAAMPKIWDSCLAGHGEIDLSGVRLLSKEQYIWAPGGWVSSATAYMASKAVNSETTAVKGKDLPGIFRDQPKFSGSVYRMEEPVLDVRSLVEELAAKDSLRSTRVHGRVASIVRGDPVKPGCVLEIVDADGVSRDLHSRYTIFSAGVGNEIAIADLGLDQEGPQTQRRPLKQIMVRPIPHALYGHCVTTDPRPRVTVTAHPIDDYQDQGQDQDTKYVWYLGGILAETTLNMSDDEMIATARKELESLFPWIDWSESSDKQWSSITVDRAEPFCGEDFFRPEPELLTDGPVAIAWPTKLTFAPALARKSLAWLQEKAEVDGYKWKAGDQPAQAVDLPRAEIGKFPWESRVFKPCNPPS